MDVAIAMHMPPSMPAFDGRNMAHSVLDAPSIAAGNPIPLVTMTYETVPSDDAEAEPGVSPLITRRFYMSHFLSTWNSRSFEFGAVLFLAGIFPGSLFQLSIYALLRSASAIFLASAIGHAVDHRGRLPILRFSIGDIRFLTDGNHAIC